MRLMFLVLLLPLLAHADPALPEGYAGKTTALMTLLYPKWEPSTQLTGSIVDGALQRARLRDAKLWESDGHRGVAVLVQTWTGDACRAATCPAEPADLAVIESAGGKLTLVAVLRGALKLAENQKASIDAPGVRVDRAATLVGVRDETESGARSLTKLRLFRLEGATLRSVFERTVREARVTQKALDAGCLATVTTDDLEAAPYPLKITERCQQTKRTAVEFWRWQGSEYKLHGPASNAAEADADDDENDR